MTLEISTVAESLMDYGLSRKEAEVYVCAASYGPCKASDIVGTLSMPRTEVYRVISGLQKIGMLEVIIGRPAKFVATPFDTAIDMLIQIHRRKMSLLESRKPELLEKWKTLEITSPSKEVKERFQILEGLGALYSKALEIVSKADYEVCLIGSERDLARADHEDVVELLGKLGVRKISTRILTEASERTREMLKGTNIQVKYTSVTAPIFPYFIIADSSELLLFIKSSKTSGMESALWTNSETLLQTMRGLFDELWKVAKPFLIC